MPLGAIEAAVELTEYIDGYLPAVAVKLEIQVSRFTPATIGVQKAEAIGQIECCPFVCCAHTHV